MQETGSSNSHPSGTYVVEVGGKVEAAAMTFTAALKAGFEIRNRNSGVPVKVCDAAERS